MLQTKISPLFAERRKQLMSMDPEGLFIFPSNPVRTRNGSVSYSYRQDSTFHYLTGFDEMGAFLILANGKSILFVLPKDAEAELWSGTRYGVDLAKSIFKMDDVFPVSELDSRMDRLIKQSTNIYAKSGLSLELDLKIKTWLDNAKPESSLLSPLSWITEMRLIKSPEEVASMRKAAEVSVRAHRVIMETLKAGVNERQIHAQLEYLFREQGSEREAYGTIVAGGKNATCLHYVENNEMLQDGELLLIDAGCEWDYYASDITRTMPIGKKFSGAQAALYDIVLESQLAALEASKPGVTLAKIHEITCLKLIEGLIQLGLLTGSSEENYSNHAYRRFYPHGTSHWLGLDVHDVGGRIRDTKPRPLQKGMAFTVEPGLYVQPGDTLAPEHFRGIGIRIEDDVVVTDNAIDILTAALPKNREEIESIRCPN